MLDLPRSVRFATWASALLRGDVLLDDAVRAIHGTDEPHEVASADGDVGDLAGTLRWLASAAQRVGVALPVPGHALGLPGPPEFNAAAVHAGECVLVDFSRVDAISGHAHGSRLNGAAINGAATGAAVNGADSNGLGVDGTRPGAARGGPAVPASGCLGLVPEVTEFGSWLEPGCLVTWRARATDPRRVVDLASLSEAERALREALMTATEALSMLDVARWRDDAADRIAAVRDGGLDRRVIPASTAPRALRVLASAARVRAIVSLACQDDGAAITSWQADHRTAALRDVDQVARRAMVAAVNLPG